MLSGNRGEWSEVYTLFKLLAEGKLYAGDANLNLLKDVYYPILSIIREESNRKNEYQIHNGNIKILINGNEEISIPKSRFLTEANKLFLTIKSNKSSFQIPELDVLLHSMGCSSLRAASTSKSDIFISLYDERLSHTVNLGFSIKSQLGSDSTLLNAGKSTNFIYEVSNVDDTILKINEIDTRSKIKDRISKLLELNAGLKFYSMENKVFMNNLTLIDSRLPEIISELLLMFLEVWHRKLKFLQII